jgi:N-acetyl-anhydromuramyl-L-alanine amidase AmpD
MSYPVVKARWFTVGRIKPVQLIVIHSAETPETAQAAENVAHYFATTDVKASAHFTVDNNSIVQSVRVEDTAWHCKNANANGIGIEHAGRANQTAEQWLDDYGCAMLELSAKLAAELCKQFHIEPVRAEFLSGMSPTVVRPGFCGHRDVPGHGSHSDPGPGFPFAYYLGRVAFYLDNPPA